MATRTAQTAASGGQVFSNPLAWTSLSVPAVDGSDNLIIPAGVTMRFDTSGIWGSNSVAVGAGLAVRATSSSSFGVVTFAPGVVCEFRGTDWGLTAESNQAVWLSAYAQFRVEGGAEVQVGNASNWQSGIAGRGRIFTDNATLLNPAKFSSPASAYTWNQTASLSPQGSSTQYKSTGNVRCVSIGGPSQLYLSNAAGTGPGSMADTSVAITGGAGATSAATCIVNPVASIAAVVNAGDYYIDHEYCVVYYVSTATTVPGWTVTGKRLALNNSWCIDLTHNVNGSEGQFDGAQFTYMGDAVNNNVRAVLMVGNKTTPGAGGTDRRFFVKNSRFQFCGKNILLGTAGGGAGSASSGPVTGSSGDPILITDNDIHPCFNDGVAGVLGVYRQACPYVHIKRNAIKARTFAVLSTDGTTARELRSWEVSDNTGTCDVLLLTNYVNDSLAYWNKGITLPNSIVERNTLTGSGQSLDAVCIAGCTGKTGEPFTVRNNRIGRVKRVANLGSFSRYHGNAYHGTMHHVHITGVSGQTHYVQNVRVYNEIYDVPGSDAPAVQPAYNNNIWTDDIQFSNITVSSVGLMEFGDRFDNSGNSIVTGLIVANCVTVRASRSASGNGILRGADTATWRGRSVPTRVANNLISNASAQYSGFSHQAVPMRSGVAYNEDGTRGILGVVLWDPSYASPPAAKSLVYTYTSATDRTIAWDGGTPQQVVADNGTATGLSTTTLNDSGKAWSTALNNAGCPRARWLVITSGSNAGAVRAILGNTGTQLTFMPPLSAVVDTTPTYVILHSELQLAGADAATVRVGIDARTLPTSSQTDTGITFDYQEPTTDPAFPIGSSAFNEDLSTIVTDFTPAAGSSVRDTGVTGSWAPSDDIIGTLRPQGAALDIGAVEGIASSTDHIRQQIPHLLRPAAPVRLPVGNLRGPTRR